MKKSLFFDAAEGLSEEDDDDEDRIIVMSVEEERQQHLEECSEGFCIILAKE